MSRQFSSKRREPIDMASIQTSEEKSLITDTTVKKDSSGEEQLFYVGRDGTKYSAESLSRDAAERLALARRDDEVLAVTWADGDVTLCTAGRSINGFFMANPQGRPRGFAPRHPKVRSISVGGKKIYEDLHAFEPQEE